MPDFHLSKSEIFFYGALGERFQPLTREPGPDQLMDDEDFARIFPVAREIWPRKVEPFQAIEELAVEFGIAKRVELEPAGWDDDNPMNPEYRAPLPDDIIWTYADGTFLQPGEFDDVVNKLHAASDEAMLSEGDADDVEVMAAFGRHPSSLLDLQSGIPQWMPKTLRQRCFKEHGDSMGPFVVEGFSPSQGGYVFRLSWMNTMYRYRVPNQDNRLYTSLVEQFVDELRPPQLVRWSLGWLQDHASDLTRATGPIGPGEAPRLTRWMKELNDCHAEDVLWKLAGNLAAAEEAASLLESLVSRHAEELVAAGLKGKAYGQVSTRQQLEDYVTLLPLVLEEMCRKYESSGRPLDEAAPEEIEVINMRFLCDVIRDLLRQASACAGRSGLSEVATLADGGKLLAQRLGQLVKGISSGIANSSDLQRTSRQLTDSASNAMKLAYGQLYFQELAAEQVYIDPSTQAQLLRESRPVREQLVEAIKQYERQTLPNCTVTSVCGLVEPTVRKMAAAWLPPGTYRGDTAAILKTLFDTVRVDLNRIRETTAVDGDPSPEEADALLKLFCINVAFGLNNLGNTVRHHAEKVLKRHEAGVMLHGLCAILHRISR